MNVIGCSVVNSLFSILVVKQGIVEGIKFRIVKACSTQVPAANVARLFSQSAVKWRKS